MIDDPMQVESLLGDLTASLPIPALVTPELRTLLRDKLGENDPAPIACRITRVEYAGDAGGIMCRLELDRAVSDGGFVVSITHLRFQGWSPLTREIVAYQKRRVKRIRREGIDVSWPR